MSNLVRLLTEHEAAAWLAVPVAHLGLWRFRGQGPRYVHAFDGARYALADLKAYKSAKDKAERAAWVLDVERRAAEVVDVVTGAGQFTEYLAGFTDPGEQPLEVVWDEVEVTTLGVGDYQKFLDGTVSKPKADPAPDDWVAAERARIRRNRSAELLAARAGVLDEWELSPDILEALADAETAEAW